MALPTSLLSLHKSDAQLAKIPYEPWFKVPSDDVIDETAKNLEKKHHKVSVVANGKEALELIRKTIPKGSAVFNGGSTTLDELGFSNELRTQTEWTNLRTKLGIDTADAAKRFGLIREGIATADYYVSSLAAVTQDGQLVAVDASGTRVYAIAFGAANVVLVVGAQKIVPTREKALERVQFCYHVESARVRVAYKMPASMIESELIMSSGAVFLPGRIHIVIVKEALGY